MCHQWTSRLPIDIISLAVNKMGLSTSGSLRLRALLHFLGRYILYHIDLSLKTPQLHQEVHNVSGVAELYE